MAKETTPKKKPATKKQTTAPKETAAPVKKYSIHETVKFLANGKAQTLLDGQVYEIHGEMANLFIEKGYGTVID